MATVVENIQNPEHNIPEREPKETEPALKELEPALKETEPVLIEYDPTSIESEPVPKETESVPKENEPVPMEYEFAPIESEPAPKETEQVPMETEPVPMEYESAPIEPEPVPKETEQVPKETEQVPKETEPLPMEYESAPIEPELGPKKTEQVPKETEASPNVSKTAPKLPDPTLKVSNPIEPRQQLSEPESSVKVTEPDPITFKPDYKGSTLDEPALSLEELTPALKEPAPTLNEGATALNEPAPTRNGPASTFKAPAPILKSPEPAPTESKSAPEEAGSAHQLTIAEKSCNSVPEFQKTVSSVINELCVEMGPLKKCFYNIPPDEKSVTKEFKATECFLGQCSFITDCPPLSRDSDEREDDVRKFLKAYTALDEQEFSEMVEYCSLKSFMRPDVIEAANNRHNESTDESEIENDGDQENTDMNEQQSIENMEVLRRTNNIEKLKAIRGLLEGKSMDPEPTVSSTLKSRGEKPSYHKLATPQKGDVTAVNPGSSKRKNEDDSKQENDNSERQNRRRSKRNNKDNTIRQSNGSSECANNEDNEEPSTSEKRKCTLHSATVHSVMRSNEEKKYRRLPQDFVDAGPDDLIPYKVLVYCIRLYRPFIAVGPTKGVVYKHKTTRGPQFQQNFYFLGSQTLADLRDVIKCPNDYGPRTDCSINPDEDYIENLKEAFPSACMFINNIFYSDMRHPKAIDYSLPIRSWARKKGYNFAKSENMEEVTFDSLKIRLGHPEVYIHQGNCEHLFTFSNVELLQPSDLCVSSTYPYSTVVRRRYAINCNMCARFIAKWVVLGCERIPNDPAYLCSECFLKYNYINGKKVGEFRAYRLLDKNIQVSNVSRE